MINSYDWNFLKTELEKFKILCRIEHAKKLDELFKPNDKGKFSFKFKKIEELSDLDSLKDTQGFYVIFTDCKYSENNCSLEREFISANSEAIKAKAIYRGEGSKVKQRLISHLFNTEHKKSDVKQMENCIQIEKGQKGIDIDGDTYKDFNWYIAILRLANSTSVIRKTIENVFDEKYGVPFASREVKVKK